MLEALLGWWEDERFVTTPARIDNISQSGCMVESFGFPVGRERTSVWFCPVGIATSGWTEGIVVSVRKPWFRGQQVHLRFQEPFPFESFKALIHGAGYLREHDRSHLPEHEQDHFWR